jgi:hypothetical protein
MPQDWFSQNAPQQSAPGGGVDWFSANAPESGRGSRLPAPRATEITRLEPREEDSFRQWANASQIADVDAPDSYYDYRGLYRELKGKPVPVTADRHFPDTYKQHGHPTFSRESKYSAGPGDGGVWQGDKYLPPGSDLDAASNRKGFTWSGLGSGLLETAEGGADFIKTLYDYQSGNPTAIRKVIDQTQQQIGGDVEGIKREPSRIAKVGRIAALPVDVLGVPATGIADKIVEGDYGKAAGLALGAAAMIEGPHAATRLRGARVLTPEMAAEAIAGRVVPEAAAAPKTAPEAAAVAAAVPSRIARVSGVDVRPDLPPEFLPVGEEGAPGPVSRKSDAAVGGREDVVDNVLRRFAAGETLGSPELRKSFAERQRVEAARADAEATRIGGPEAVTAGAAASELPADEALYRELRDDAKAKGYRGTDAQLRSEFNKRLDSAQKITDSTADADDNSYRALLQAVADGGGLRLNDPTGRDPYSGELSSLAENSKSFVVGQGLSKATGGVKGSRVMPRMELGGVQGILRNDGTGRTLDGMLEYLKQDPRFDPHLGDINDLLDVLNDASRSVPKADQASLAEKLAATGVQKGAAWWADPDAVSSRGVGRLEGPELLEEPPADWFTQNAPEPVADAGSGGGGRMPGDEDFGGGDTGNGGEPPATGGEIPAQRPLSASAVSDEGFISKLPEDLQPTLRQVWSDHAGFEEQRRGVQPLARTQALADHAQLPESVAPGTAFNAEQMTAAYDRLISKEREYQQLKPKVENGTATDAEWLRHRELDTERVLAGERVRGAVAETGRSMRAIRAKVEELKAIQVAQQSNDPALVQQTREALSRGGFNNALRSYVYGNLVSGVATQERNFMGNTLMFANDVMADVVTGKPGAAGAMVVGALNGLPRGLKEFAYVMRHGGNAEAGAGKIPITRELPGGILNPWNDALRMLSATDRLWRAIDNRAEVTRRAWVEAGKGANRIDRAARLIAEHPEWHADAEHITTNRLFQDKGGPVTELALKLRDSMWGGFLVSPFIRISANLTRMAVVSSPVPYVLHLANKIGVAERLGGQTFQLGRDLAAAGRVGELARARAAYGTLVLAALTPYALNGNVTGDGPRDPGKRAIWLQTHQPNSIKVGGRWVSLQDVAWRWACAAGTRERRRGGAGSEARPGRNRRLRERSR